MLASNDDACAIRSRLDRPIGCRADIGRVSGLYALDIAVISADRHDMARHTVLKLRDTVVRYDLPVRVAI
ncbi:hypothetical protein D3C84_654210 [compost metagenome]